MCGGLILRCCPRDPHGISGTRRERERNCLNSCPSKFCDETLRLIAAFKHVQANPDEVCPMNWTPGDKTMNPDPEKSQDYFKDVK